jgi:dihydroxyacetone kinase-like protein
VVLDVNWTVKWLTLCAQAMAEHRVELIELDRAIGDSDHGENMDRGFQAVLDKLAESPPETPGAALKLTAMTLMSKVGGAAGPLYGTAFLRAATSLGDAPELILPPGPVPSPRPGTALWPAGKPSWGTRPWWTPGRRRLKRLAGRPKTAALSR